MEQIDSKPLQQISCPVEDANIFVNRFFMGINPLNSTNKVNTKKVIVNLYNKRSAHLKMLISL